MTYTANPTEVGASVEPARSTGARVRSLAADLWPFAIAATVTFLAFFPGHPTGDTDDTYLQARRELPVENWHPTFNVVIYRMVFSVWDQPAAILALQCLLVWGGLAGIAVAMRRQWRRPTARYLVPLGFLPIVFNYLGALMKDTLSMGFTVVALACLLVERTAARHRGWLLLGAVVCLWPAYLVKISMLPVVAALLVYIGGRAGLHRRRGAVLLVAAGAASLGLVAISPRLVDDALDAKDAQLEHALELFDLAGITHFSGRNVLGTSILPRDRIDDVVDGRCYDPGSWDPMGWTGDCSFVSTNALPMWDTDVLQQRWRQAIIDHPLDYARHRLTHVVTFALRPGSNQFYYHDENEQLDWVARPNALMDAYDSVIAGTATWPHNRPIVWELASAVLFALLLRRRRRGRTGPFDPVLLATMAGNVLFYVAWLAIGVSSELRYSYTITVSCLITVSVLGAERFAGRRGLDQPVR